MILIHHLPRLFANKNLLIQIIINLLKNAEKPVQKKVKLKLKPVLIQIKLRLLVKRKFLLHYHFKLKLLTLALVFQVIYYLIYLTLLFLLKRRKGTWIIYSCQWVRRNGSSNRCLIKSWTYKFLYEFSFKEILNKRSFINGN